MGFRVPPEMEAQILAMPGVLVNGKPVNEGGVPVAPTPQEADGRKPRARPSEIREAPVLALALTPPDPLAEANKTERAYAETVIYPAVSSGSLVCWRFQPFSFRLAANTRYTPDFLTVDKDGRLRLVEVKALWKSKAGKETIHFEDDAAVKIKVAAETYPFFEWVAVGGRKVKDAGWKWEERVFTQGVRP